MTTLDMTGRLGSSLRGTELMARHRGATNLEGLRHGPGSYSFSNSFFGYQGDFVAGEMHGVGRLAMGDGGSYEGDFVDGEIIGRGIRAWPDGRRYEGQFVLGEMDGEGTHTAPGPDGVVTYQGKMASNRREGHGVLTGGGGDVFEGEFRRNRPHGRGKQSLAVSGECYDGVGGELGV
jgi:hypothetical protein